MDRELYAKTLDELRRDIVHKAHVVAQAEEMAVKARIDLEGLRQMEEILTTLIERPRPQQAGKNGKVGRPKTGEQMSWTRAILEIGPSMPPRFKVRDLQDKLEALGYTFSGNRHVAYNTIHNNLARLNDHFHKDGYGVWSYIGHSEDA